MRHKARLSGEPIGDPRICSKTQLPMENCHLQRHEDNGFHVSNTHFASDIQGTTRASFDHISSVVACGGFD